MTIKLANNLVACESLTQEHLQMGQLLESLERSISLGELEEARAVMAQIEPAMNTHFACEEQVLFPAVSPYHPMVLMEMEHEELIALRTQFQDLLNQSKRGDADLSVIQTTGNQFISNMLDHIGREDAGIFPACERSLSDNEKASVITGMKSLREKACDAALPTPTPPVRSFEVFRINLQSAAEKPLFSERLLDNGVLEMKHLVIKAGESVPSHWALKQGTLVCLSGDSVFTANQEQVALKAGVSIVMSPQVLYGLEAHTDCHFLLLLI
jgi:hemerythrin-like domain-containing protein/quercetin dioxygenase-like cupin family protein